MIFITVVFMSFGLSGMGASSMGEVLGEGCWDQVCERVEGCWLQVQSLDVYVLFWHACVSNYKKSIG